MRCEALKGVVNHQSWSDTPTQQVIIFFILSLYVNQAKANFIQTYISVELSDVSKDKTWACDRLAWNKIN